MEIVLVIFRRTFSSHHVQLKQSQHIRELKLLKIKGDTLATLWRSNKKKKKSKLLFFSEISDKSV